MHPSSRINRSCSLTSFTSTFMFWSLPYLWYLKIYLSFASFLAASSLGWTCHLSLWPALIHFPPHHYFWRMCLIQMKRHCNNQNFHFLHLMNFPRALLSLQLYFCVPLIAVISGVWHKIISYVLIGHSKEYLGIQDSGCMLKIKKERVDSKDYYGRCRLCFDGLLALSCQKFFLAGSCKPAIALR